jgi:hypothetical protein
MLAAGVAIGAVLVVGWLILVNGSLILPRFSAAGPVVRNGVAVVVVCGKKRGVEEGSAAVADYAPEPRTGVWADRQRGDCTVWYHLPPERQQREARQDRAAAR